MLDQELDMAHEHGPQRLDGRLRLRGCAIDAVQQPALHPLHDRTPDCILVRKMAKQRTLRQVHVPGDRIGGDLAGVLGASKLDDGLDGLGAPLFGWKLFS